MRLLEEKVVELQIVDRAKATARLVAFEKTSEPDTKKCWVIPPEANAAFVAAMEDVLAVYQRPHDPKRPLVCLDETSKQRTSEYVHADANEARERGPL